VFSIWYYILKFLVIYLCIDGIFCFPWALIVLDNDDKWYQIIYKSLIMPFIVVGGIVSCIIDDIKRRKDKNK
jgi:hypothetical protein